MYAIYAVNVSGGVTSSTCIFDDTSPALEHQLINPKLQLSAGAAGSLTITVPKTNAGFSAISRLTTTIKVKRDSVEIWRGRVLTESKDLWNNRVLFCEGCLAFLNDSIQSSSTAVTGQVSDYISALLTNHNAKIASNRQVSLGTVSVEDPAGEISRYLNGETTLALLQKLVNELGGVLRTRFSGETILLDYLKEYPSSGTLSLNTGELTSGYIGYSSGNAFNSTVSYITGFVSIQSRPAGSRLKYSKAFFTSSSNTSGTFFYDSSQAPISGSGIRNGRGASTNHYEDSTVDIPANAAYVRFTALNPTSYPGFYASLTWNSGVAAQEIDLEENLLDFTRDWDNTDFCTVVLPRGARLQTEDSNLQSYLDISGATAPSGYTILDTKYLQRTSLATYGRIEKVVDFSDIGANIDDPEEIPDYPTLPTVEDPNDPTDEEQAALDAYQDALDAYNAAVASQTAYNTAISTAKGQLINAAADYLANQQYDGMTLELTAVDMHMVNPATVAWNLLDKVTVKAVPYFDPRGKTFAIVGMQIPLDAPEKTKYTLGPDSAPKVRRVLSLTKQQQKAQAGIEDDIADASSFAENSAVKKSNTYSDNRWTTELDVDGSIGKIQAYVGDEDLGSYASLSVMATSIEGEVVDARGSYASLDIRVEEIQGSVYDSNTGEYTVMTIDANNGVTIGNGQSATQIDGGFLDADTIHVHQLFGNTITLNDDNDSPHSYIYLRDSSHAIYPGVLEIQAPNGGIALEAQYGNLYLHGSQSVVIDTAGAGIIWLGSTVKPNATGVELGWQDHPFYDVWIQDSNGNAVSVKQALGI